MSTDQSLWFKLQYGPESRNRVSRFTLNSTDTEINKKYTQNRAQLMNFFLVPAVVMLCLSLLFAGAHAAFVQTTVHIIHVVSHELRLLLFIPIWYLLRKSETRSHQTPYLLVPLFYMACAESMIVTFNALQFSALEPKDNLMDLTIALYSCFAINLIDTKLLMVFVVPGYIVMSMIRMVHLQSMCEVD